MLFFSFQRSIGIASCDERGNSSKCCTKTRITGSGSIKATCWLLARRRGAMVAIAVFQALAVDTMGSFPEGTLAAGGESSTVNLFPEPVVHRVSANPCRARLI